LHASVVGDVIEPKQILIAVIGMLVRNGKLNVVPGTNQIPLVVAGPTVPDWKLATHRAETAETVVACAD
jgi:hypothetical protein